MKKWRKRISITLLILLVLVATSGAYLRHRLRLDDAQHARFLDSGKTINTFLKSYAAAIEMAFTQQDSVELMNCYSERYASPRRGVWAFAEQQDLGDATSSTLTVQGQAACDRALLSHELSGYVAGISAVDYVACKIDLIEQLQPDQSAVLTVKYILDGRDGTGQLFQDRFFFRWWLECESGHGGVIDWRIVRDELVEGVRVAGRGDGFERMDGKLIGVDYVHRRDPKLNARDPNVKLKFGVIEHAGGGVSAVDYDDDGNVDLFFADGVRSRLFRNTGQPTASGWFEDVTTQAGLDGLDQSHCGLFADIDNDGDKDLFVSRYMATCRLFLNKGDGTFVDVSAQFGVDLVAPCVSACLLDYDSDGYVDLFIGVNGNAFKEFPELPFYAQNAEPNRLLRNVDGKRFEDVTQPAGVGSTGWTLAVCAGDYDNDGRPDIAVADDFGRKRLHHNNGDGSFTDMAKDAGVLDLSGGMGIAFGDLNDDGYPDLYTSNINSNQRWFGEETTVWQYNRNVIRTKWFLTDLPRYREVYQLLGGRWKEFGKMIGEGNSLFYNNRDGTFRELHDSHTSRAGWGWGISLFDVDNDTDLDIYACNGWISGKKKDDL